MTSSQTQYIPRGRYHGNTTGINFRWTGFDPSDGVKSYLVNNKKENYLSLIYVLIICFRGDVLSNGEFSLNNLLEIKPNLYKPGRWFPLSRKLERVIRR